MKPDDILDAIGNINDENISNAKNHKKPKSKIWISVGAVAACLIMFFLIPNIPNFFGYSSKDENEQSHTADHVLLYDFIDIYYVSDNEIISESVYLPYSGEEIFNYWRDKNRIGKEVAFFEIKIESNSKTTVSEFQGEGVVEHEIGDNFIFNITISKNIQNYYNSIDKELLLESLKQTMTSYSSIEFDEYNLILK